MDLSALARDMLLWEKKRRELDELEQSIKDSVLQIGKTQTVGNVRASFYKPRNSYDYETPGQDAPMSVQLEHSKIVTDWRAVCKDAGIEPIVTPGEGMGSVTLKLVG